MILDKKELSKLYIFYFVLVCIINLVSYLSIIFIPGYIAFWIAVIWIVVTIIFYFIVRNHNVGLIIYSVCNAIISGIAISAYYSSKDVIPFNYLLYIAVFGIIMMLSYKIVSNMKKYNDLYIKINIGISVFLLFISILLWIAYSATIGSGMVFFSIFYLCFNISMLSGEIQRTNYFMIVGFSSFIMFAGILVVVLVALSDGDGIEILDINFWNRSNKKKI